MPDPFDALRTPLVPLAPDPSFAARLRARVARALTEPRGATVSTTSTPTTVELNPRHGDIGYVSLNVPDVERAATFYARVLGWRYVPGSSAQGHRVEGQTLHHGLWGGEEHNTLFLCLTVDDIAAAVERIRAAGGTAEEPHEAPYGLVSDCTDDQGMQFAIFQPPPGPAGAGPANGAHHGDISYITLEVVDSARFLAFIGAVAGWRAQPGHVDDGWQVEDVVPMSGVSGGHERATVVPMYRVDDIDDAVERVRAAGGTATDPQQQPYGITSECVDDQGTRFYLGQH